MVERLYGIVLASFTFYVILVRKLSIYANRTTLKILLETKGESQL